MTMINPPQFGAIHKYNSNQELLSIRERLAKGGVSDLNSVVVDTEYRTMRHQVNTNDRFSYTPKGAVLTGNDANKGRLLLDKLKTVRSLLSLNFDAREIEGAISRALNLGNRNDDYLSHLPSISEEGFTEILETIKRVAQKEEKQTEQALWELIG